MTWVWTQVNELFQVVLVMTGRSALCRVVLTILCLISNLTNGSVSRFVLKKLKGRKLDYLQGIWLTSTSFLNFKNMGNSCKIE